jgi:ribonuclease VapC
MVVDTSASGWQRYGKGRHPAALNIADCCVYALCKATDEALLFKGADFSRTDLRIL